MSTGIRRKQFADHSFGQQNQYEVLQAIIAREHPGIKCSVLVKPGIVSIRTADYGDYLLAKKAIKGRVSEEIIWST